MRSGGQERTTRNLRLASTIGLILAVLAIGGAHLNDATALDEPKQFFDALKKNASPAKGKPVAPLQRLLSPKPVGQKGPTGTVVGNKNAITHPGEFGKGTFGKNSIGRT